MIGASLAGFTLIALTIHDAEEDSEDKIRNIIGGPPSTSPTEPEDEQLNPINRPIEVEVGRKFSIALESRPVTGYRWRFIHPLDEKILELVGSEYKGPEDERIGAGGEEVLTFRAVSQGETTIALGYGRPWERNVPPTKTRTFAVVVGPRL